MEGEILEIRASEAEKSIETVQEREGGKDVLSQDEKALEEKACVRELGVYSGERGKKRSQVRKTEWPCPREREGKPSEERIHPRQWEPSGGSLVQEVEE